MIEVPVVLLFHFTDKIIDIYLFNFLYVIDIFSTIISINSNSKPTDKRKYIKNIKLYIIIKLIFRSIN